MNYAELTPTSGARYDGSMPGQSDGAAENLAKAADTANEAFQTFGKSVNEFEQQMKAAGAHLREAVKEGRVEESPPANYDPSPEQHAAEGEKKHGHKTTRERLVEIARGVQRVSNPGEVVSMAEEVAAAASFLENAFLASEKTKDDPQKDIRKKFEKEGLVQDARQINKTIREFKNLPTGKDDPGARGRAVMSQAGRVAELANQISNYFERAQLAPQEVDPYRNIVSFEELMTKFAIIQDNPKFRPGGEFALIDIQEYQDEFGRTLSKETAHPENFLRWVRERIEFYHDFDPMAPIDLFKNLYIVAGYRSVTLYEMTVDFSVYFNHRVDSYGDVRLSTRDLQTAISEGKLKDPGKDPKTNAVTGYYDYIDPETGSKVKAEIIPISINPRTGEEIYGAFYINKNGERVPVQGVLKEKDEWNYEANEEFNVMKNQILYEAWLMTYNHNNDVNYRQKGMPSEKTLDEVMAELYGVNIFTRTRDRIYKVFNMASTTHRTEESTNEALDQMRKEGKPLDHQGSVGKAFQRSLAAYYHISEANAAFEKYELQNDRNPFKELLQKRDKEGRLLVDGSEIFYKSVIRRTLVENFGYNSDDKVAVDLTNTLNKVRIPRGDGTFRARYDWEKADLYDVLFQDGNSLQHVLLKQNFTNEQFNEAVTILRKKYGDKQIEEIDARGNTIMKANPNYNEKKLEELNNLLTSNAQQKKEKVFVLGNFKSPHGGYLNGINEDLYKQKEDMGRNGKPLKENGYMYDFIHGNMSIEKFSVHLWQQAFPSEFSQDLNPFINIGYSLEARDRMRQAMRDVLVTTEHLDDFEALYAEEWAYTMTYHTGISARNDMQGIGHDAWSKMINTEAYRLRQTGGGNYYGNIDNLYGIHRLGVDFWEGMKVQPVGSNEYNKTMYEELTGLEYKKDEHGNIIDAKFNIDKDMESYEFYGNAMRQFYADHLNHVIALFQDITSKHEFNFNNVVAEDALGRVVINHAEMQKMIDTTWKHLRYGFDNRAFLYDNPNFGWLYEEAIDAKTGKITRTPSFGFKTIRDLMFSKEVQSMDMYRRNDVSSWADTEQNQQTKMARNVFAYLIAMQLKEHVTRKGEAILYSADQISIIADAFINYAARVMRGEDAEAIVLSGFFSPEEMRKILVMAHAMLWMLYAKEYGEDLLGGIFAAIFQGLSLVMKEVGAGITLKS